MMAHAIVIVVIGTMYTFVGIAENNVNWHNNAVDMINETVVLLLSNSIWIYKYKVPSSNFKATS